MKNFIRSSFSSMRTRFRVSFHRFSEQTQPIKKAPTSKRYSVWIIFVKGPEGLENQTLKMPMPVTSERFRRNFPNSKTTRTALAMNGTWAALKSSALCTLTKQRVFSPHQREHRRSGGGNQDQNLNSGTVNNFLH